jgi:hypothetical protein
LLLGLLCSAPQALVAPACAQPGTCYESCHVVGVLRGVRVMRGVRVKPRLSVTCSQSCQGCVPASGNPCPPHATRGACGCQRGWRGERGRLFLKTWHAVAQTAVMTLTTCDTTWQRSLTCQLS